LTALISKRSYDSCEVVSKSRLGTSREHWSAHMQHKHHDYCGTAHEREQRE
jgi:hypothetical protein